MSWTRVTVPLEMKNFVNSSLGHRRPATEPDESEGCDGQDEVGRQVVQRELGRADPHLGPEPVQRLVQNFGVRFFEQSLFKRRFQKVFGLFRGRETQRSSR